MAARQGTFSYFAFTLCSSKTERQNSLLQQVTDIAVMTKSTNHTTYKKRGCRGLHLLSISLSFNYAMVRIQVAASPYRRILNYDGQKI